MKFETTIFNDLLVD